MLTVQEIMTEHPVVVDASAPVRDAVELLNGLEVRHLPVLSDGELVGVLSDRDLRDVALPPTPDEETLQVLAERLDEPVASLMSGPPISVPPESDVSEVIDLMLENRVGAVPVVNSVTEDLVGIVSYVDVLRTVRGRLEEDLADTDEGAASAR